MCGAGTQTATSSNALPDWALPGAQALVNRGLTESTSPWANTAGMTPAQLSAMGLAPGATSTRDMTIDQNASMQGARDAQGAWMPYNRDATRMAGSASNLSAMSASAPYMNASRDWANAAGQIDGAGAMAPYMDAAGNWANAAGGMNAIDNISPYLSKSMATGALDTARPYIDAAGTSAAGTVGNYMNPYNSAVTDRLGVLAGRNLSENLLPQVNNTFVGAGMFGSDRSADFTRRAMRDTQESLLGQQANVLQQGYQGALGAAQTDLARQAQLAGVAGGLADSDAGRALQAGTLGLNATQADINKNLAVGAAQGNLGNMALAGAQSGINRNLAVGAAQGNLGSLAQAGTNADRSGLLASSAQYGALGQQNQEQRYQDASSLMATGNQRQQQNMSQTNFNWDQLARLGSVMQGTPMPTTQTNTSPGPSIWSQLGGAALAGYGMYRNRKDGGRVQRFASGGSGTLDQEARRLMFAEYAAMNAAKATKEAASAPSIGGPPGLQPTITNQILDATRKVESNDGRYTLSPKGAKGDYGLTDAASRDIDPYNTNAARERTAEIWDGNLAAFGGNYYDAARAFHAGRSGVTRDLAGGPQSLSGVGPLTNAYPEKLARAMMDKQAALNDELRLAGDFPTGDAVTLSDNIGGVLGSTPTVDKPSLSQPAPTATVDEGTGPLSTNGRMSDANWQKMIDEKTAPPQMSDANWQAKIDRATAKSDRLEWDNPFTQAGFAMMASKNPSFLGALGEAGLSSTAASAAKRKEERAAESPLMAKARALGVDPRTPAGQAAINKFDQGSHAPTGMAAQAAAFGLDIKIPADQKKFIDIMNDVKGSNYERMMVSAGLDPSKQEDREKGVALGFTPHRSAGAGPLSDIGKIAYDFKLDLNTPGGQARALEIQREGKTRPQPTSLSPRDVGHLQMWAGAEARKTIEGQEKGPEGFVYKHKEDRDAAIAELKERLYNYARDGVAQGTVDMATIRPPAAAPVPPPAVAAAAAPPLPLPPPPVPAGPAAPVPPPAVAAAAAPPLPPVPAVVPAAPPAAPPRVQPETKQAKLEKMPPKALASVVSNLVGISSIDDALREIEAYPEGLGKRRWAESYLPGGVIDTIDPKGVKVRAAIAGIGGIKLHDLSGAAVAVQEFARLRPYVPQVGDDAKTAKEKLEKFKTEYRDILKTTYAVYAPSKYDVPAALTDFVTRGTTTTNPLAHMTREQLEAARARQQRN